MPGVIVPRKAVAEVQKLVEDLGAEVVVEDFLEGEEASFFALCDGTRALAFTSAQDHKRVGEGDTGPNTGGMGAYSPAPVVTPDVHARVMREIVQPTIAGMARDGHPFSGFLYAGLMIDAQGRPRTVEFNARLGDPEAEVILMRLKSDLFELLMAATEGQLASVDLQWDRRVALGVVVAARGYPASPRKGDALTALPAASPELQVFHAGTMLDGGMLKSSGGRVLCVTALGDTVRLAQQRAYSVIDQIGFDGAQWRRDIGHRALKA
jgi:phosphoribosylamine--glycine ligase